MSCVNKFIDLYRLLSLSKTNDDHMDTRSIDQRITLMDLVNIINQSENINWSVNNYSNVILF